MHVGNYEKIWLMYVYVSVEMQCMHVGFQWKCNQCMNAVWSKTFLIYHMQCMHVGIYEKLWTMYVYVLLENSNNTLYATYACMI